ncbi:diaminopimelate decarboxylase [Oleidesulfovibrio sp.]|uniref:diaminopimelate decarboxylase n=1 Tax=Oleidesulfovibrio sp. TaxID=2909707 RepID=UPI003A85D9B0
MSNVRSAVTDEQEFYGLSTPMELVETYGSPLYVYNENILRKRCRELKALSSHPGFRVNYSAKANANLSLLRIIRSEGLVVDAMSPGEIAMHLAAGFTPDEITYVCNNVSAEELRNAVEHGLLVSVDSLAQLELLGQVNPGGKVMIRINPGIGAGHHAKVVTGGKDTKFGIGPDDGDKVREILARYDLTLAGLNQHIGSLFMEPDSYIEAMKFLLREAEQWDDIEVIDFGGGFGIPYRKYEGQARLDMQAMGEQLHACISEWAERTGYQGRFMIEPGRYVVAECGVVLGTVHSVKNNGPRRFAGTDLGFNVLQRPVMYDAHHDVEIYREDGTPVAETMLQTVVGNICESGDIMARERDLPEIQEGDIVGMLDSGAYGFAMCSSYNQRQRPAEVLIDSDGKDKLIRRRETIEDLLSFYPEFAATAEESKKAANM